MSKVKELLQVCNDFKKQTKENPTEAFKTLEKLKSEFINFKTFLPCNNLHNLSEEEKAEILLVRETLEYATLLSAQTKDLKSFERNVAQVKTYYLYNLYYHRF
jgi:hypothetical protein